MKRIKVLLSFLLVVAMAVSLLTGFSYKTSAGKSKAAGAGKTKITVWHYFDGQAQQKAMETLANKYNSSQDKIEVSVEFVPRAELTKQFTIGLVADKLPDIGLVDNPDMASFAAMGLFADISKQMNAYPDKDKFFPGPISSCKLNGKYYGIPLGSNDLALYYNKDMFAAAKLKPPTNFAELKIAAKKLTKAGTTYGLAIAAPKNEEGTFQYLPWLLSTGAKFNQVGSVQGISALTYLTGLIKDGSMSKEVINWTQNDLEKQFVTNKAAMIVDGPWIISTVKADAPKLNWGVVKIPKDKVYSSDLGGENWGVIKGHHEVEAWEFIKFTQQKDIMNAYCADFGYIPSRKDIAESNDKITKDPIMSVFLDELQYAMPRGPHPKWPQISDAMSTAMQECFTNTKTPAKAAQEAQVKINAILK
jgi:multiple sugar transport system substrate-binding protein